MHVRRVEDDVDLYYLANAKHAENRRLVRVTQDVWLTATDRSSVPYLLDAWSGTVTPVASYERDGDRVRVSVDLLPGQSTVIALAPPSRSERTPAVTASTGEVRRDGSKVVLRTAAAGAHSVTLASGRVVRTSVDRVREAVVPTSWRLVRRGLAARLVRHVDGPAGAPYHPRRRWRRGRRSRASRTSRASAATAP